MATRRISAAEVLHGIMDLPSEESGDESDRDSDNNEDEPQIDSSSSSSSDGDFEDNSEMDQVQGRDGTMWRVVRDAPGRGRTPRRNIFNEQVGVTRVCDGIVTPLDAWHLVFDIWILNFIVECTKEFARESARNWDLTKDELEKFIGLLYLRGVMNQRNYPFEQLWSKTYGCPTFNKTMSRQRMREIKKFLRFDRRRDRRRNLQHDKFCLISTVLERFVSNSQRCFRPSASLTIDEQLFPTKTRCRFTQYMPSKPDKFGIKFWILADVPTKYCYNVKPYLGRDERRHESLGTHVVQSLMEPLYKKGYNVTMDNFFTSKHLAQLMLQERTTIVGTVRSNRRELPPSQRLSLHESIFYECDNLHLTRYQSK